MRRLIIIPTKDDPKKTPQKPQKNPKNKQIETPAIINVLTLLLHEHFYCQFWSPYFFGFFCKIHCLTFVLVVVRPSMSNLQLSFWKIASTLLPCFLGALRLLRPESGDINVSRAFGVLDPDLGVFFHHPRSWYYAKEGEQKLFYGQVENGYEWDI